MRLLVQRNWSVRKVKHNMNLNHFSLVMITYFISFPYIHNHYRIFGAFDTRKCSEFTGARYTPVINVKEKIYEHKNRDFYVTEHATYLQKM